LKKSKKIESQQEIALAFSYLPREIQQYILSFINRDEMKKISLVCKEWYKYVEDLARLYYWQRSPICLQHQNHSFHFLVVGEGFSGRLSFARRFVEGTFKDKVDPVIQETFRKHIKQDGVSILIDLTVTAGQEEYISLRDYYLEKSEGVFVVYSISSHGSFEVAQQMCKDVSKRNIPIIVVGSKQDLEHLREVSYKEGKKLADAYSSFRHNFFEISSKENKGVEKPVIEMVYQCAVRPSSLVCNITQSPPRNSSPLIHIFKPKKRTKFYNFI